MSTTAPTLDVRRPVSGAMFALCCGATVAIIGVLVLVASYLLVIGMRHLSLDLFLTDPTGRVDNPGGLRHAILGTAILLGVASMAGVPLGILAGVYLSEYRRETWLARPTRFIADVLTGVPSIVVGILGYELVVVPLSRAGWGGYSGWAGAAALAFIMIPIVARTTEEMLRLVPQSYRAGSLALGATQAQTVLRVVLPAAAGSVVTGVMLAMARVAGETAPLLFTALGARALTTDLSQPFPSLTVQIYQYATGPYPAQKQVAWSGILVLILLLLVVNISVRVITARSVRIRN